jgi:tetratricopeptide (TPR) repeat protein
MAAPLSNIGSIHFMKGEYNQAMQYFQKALLLDRISENSYEISDSLFNLVRVFIEMEKYTEATKYREELEKINKKTDSKLVDLRNKIAQALILKTSKRTIAKAKAQEILTGISKDKIHDFEYYILANLALIELLLNELKDTGEEEIIEEIRYYIEIMEDQAKEKSAFSIQAETYLLHSQLALIQLEINKAEHYIDRAYSISKSHGITKIEMKASDLQDELMNTISKWEELIEVDASLSDRIKEANIEELLNVMIAVKEEENLERKTIQPALFMILAEGGVKIYEKKFKEGAKLKSGLISGLLTAIHGLSENAFSTHSSVQRIKHNEYTVIIKPINQILFCFVFKGKSYTALRKLDDIVGYIKDSRIIWSALVREIPGLSESEILGMDLIIDDVLELELQVLI